MPPVEPTTVTVAVSVSYDNDGTPTPVENADVTLTDAEEHEYTGRTGSAGGCNIQNVPVGTYTVTATATGYTDYESSEDVEITEESHSLSITMTEAPAVVEPGTG